MSFFFLLVIKLNKLTVRYRGHNVQSADYYVAITGKKKDRMSTILHKDKVHVCHQQGGNGGYELSVSQEKQDTRCSEHASLSSFRVRRLNHWLASFSPKLFFFIHNKLICTHLCLVLLLVLFLH